MRCWQHRGLSSGEIQRTSIAIFTTSNTWLISTRQVQAVCPPAVSIHSRHVHKHSYYTYKCNTNTWPFIAASVCCTLLINVCRKILKLPPSFFAIFMDTTFLFYLFEGMPTPLTFQFKKKEEPLSTYLGPPTWTERWSLTISIKHLVRSLHPCFIKEPAAHHGPSVSEGRVQGNGDSKCPKIFLIPR